VTLVTEHIFLNYPFSYFTTVIRCLSVNSPELFFGLFRVRVRIRVRVRVGVRVNSVTETNIMTEK